MPKKELTSLSKRQLRRKLNDSNKNAIKRLQKPKVTIKVSKNPNPLSSVLNLNDGTSGIDLQNI
jgi:hypothetical protein